MGKQVITVEIIIACIDCPNIRKTKASIIQATYPFYCEIMPVGNPSKKLLTTCEEIPIWCKLEDAN